MSLWRLRLRVLCFLLLSLLTMTQATFLLPDTGAVGGASVPNNNKTFMYYSPVGSLVPFPVARNICTSVGGSIITMQSDQELDILPNYFKSNAVWMSSAAVINVPATSAAQYRYSWPDGSRIDSNLWTGSPAVATAEQQSSSGEAGPVANPAAAPAASTATVGPCRALAYSQLLGALIEEECKQRLSVVCKTLVTSVEMTKISKLLPDLEKNAAFEPLPHLVSKLVAILSRTDTPPTPAQIDRAAQVMTKANIAFEERTKIKLMNQLIEANNSKTAYALTLGYIALGFAFAVVILLLLVVAGTLIRKPDIRLISMPGMRKKSGVSFSQTRDDSVVMTRANGEKVNLSGIVTGNTVADQVL